jgi:hypothetical protein
VARCLALAAVLLVAAAAPLGPAKPVYAQQVPPLASLGEIPMGTLDAVAVQGQRAYVGVGPRLAVLDIAEPQLSVLLGFSSALSDTVQAIATDPASPGQVVVAAGRAGTVVFDVASSPVPGEVLRLGGRSGSVQVTATHAFVLGDALRIFVREPDSLREVGRIEIPIEAFHVVDEIVWLATGAAGVVAYDISDPSRPAPIGALDTVGDSHDIRVSGSTAYVADGGLRLSVLDVSVPTTPTLAGEYLLDVSDEPECPSAGSDCGLDVRRVRLAGDRVVVSAYRTLGAFSGRTRPRVLLLEAAQPASLRLLSQVKLGANPVAIAADGTRVLVAKRPLWWYAGVAPCQLQAGGLDVYDADLAPLGGYDAPVGANAVALFDDTVWLADVIRDIRAYDIEDPGAPLPVTATARQYGSVYGSPEARDLVVDAAGARLAFGGQSSGFLVDRSAGVGRAFAVLRPAAPSPLAGPEPGRPCNGCAPPPGDQWYRRIATDGARDYLLDLSGGMQVIELGEGARSGRLAPVDALDVAARDHMAYLVGAGGLTAVDAADPTKPRPVGSLSLSGYGNAVSVAPDAAVVAMVGASGLAIVDVRRDDPVALGFAATPAESRDVAIYGHTVYVVAGDALHAFDASDPARPVEAARSNGVRDARAVAADGTRTAVLAGGGLFLFDALPDDGSPPRLPDEPGRTHTVHLPYVIQRGP